MLTKYKKFYIVNNVLIKTFKLLINTKYKRVQAKARREQLFMSKSAGANRANISQDRKRKEDLKKFLGEKLEEIRQAYLEFYPDGDYLTFHIRAQEGFASANNEYWDEEPRNAVDFYYWGNSEE